jgi:hypothetical protein
MAIVGSVLYLLAASLLFYRLYHAMTPMRLGLIGLFLVAALDGQQWFLPLWADTNLWPATNLTSLFAAAWAGLNGPAEMGQLIIVAVGRFLALMVVFYGLVWAVMRGQAALARVSSWPVPMRLMLGAWVILSAVAFLGAVVINVPSSSGVVLAQILAAGAALAYAVWDVRRRGGVAATAQ